MDIEGVDVEVFCCLLFIDKGRPKQNTYNEEPGIVITFWKLRVDSLSLSYVFLLPIF